MSVNSSSDSTGVPQLHLSITSSGSNWRFLWFVMRPNWQHHDTTTVGWWRKTKEQTAGATQCGSFIADGGTNLQSEVTLESWISRQITVWQTGLLWEQIIKQSQGLLLCHKGKMFSNSLQCCKDEGLISKSKQSNSLIWLLSLFSLCSEMEFTHL